MEISHEEFIVLYKKKGKYEKMKENVKNVSKKLQEKTENMRPNSVNSRRTSWSTYDWLKIIEHLHHPKILVFCVCMVMYTYSIKAWSIIDLEAIKYDG